MLRRFLNENQVVYVLVFLTSIFPSPNFIAFVGALAVYLSFTRMQVGIYLARGLRVDPRLESWSGWPAEICWTIYFLLMHCYPALIGVGINVGYRIYMSKNLVSK